MLQSEQKSVGWMMDFWAKLSGPGHLWVAFCSEARAEAKECPLFLRYGSLWNAEQMKVESNKRLPTR